jgi:pentafunctional AROM polypeptide
MPVVYTVRTQHQAGTYPDDASGISKMFELLEWGLRGGVEVLDVETAWDIDKTNQLLDLAEERYSSQILGSHHVVGNVISTEEAVELFEQCALSGRAHGAKVVLSIDSDEQDRMAYEAALIASELAASEGAPEIPNISLILGDVGQFSRVINLPFTPVTHESLPFKAAPGQLTASEIMATRLMTGIFQPKKYAILGHNIAYSVSPQMHGAAFAATKLPNEYLRVDVPTVEEFVESEMFQSDTFGGTSITIPHKQAITPYVDVLSDAAKEIGSVNTLIARQEFVDDDFKRVIYGDNTDWKGIYNPLDRLLGSTVDPETDHALILGAGGTARAAAFVAKKLGLRIIYYNRTPSKAKGLAETFGGEVASNLDETSEKGSLGDLLGATTGKNSVRVVISTLPAASEFVLPNWFLAHNSRLPIIFDVNYKPYTTKLLKQAEDAGCKVVRGSEMLWEQGVGQFELWTARTAPYSVMKRVVLDNCRETREDTQAKGERKQTATGCLE